MWVIEAEGLSKSYRRGRSVVHALQDVNLRVAPGEFLAVMGPSGSGKSTLLHLLGCLDRPTAGVLRLGNLEVTRLPDDRLPRIRQRCVGFVFQQHNLIPTLSALENVMLPMRYTGVPAAKRRRRAAALLRQVGLNHRLHHRPGELSGGEQQRVAVARALANRPAILLADEPTGELDSRTSQEVIQLMRRLNREAGVTVLVVTHDPLVARATDRIVLLRDGRIVADRRRR